MIDSQEQKLPDIEQRHINRRMEDKLHDRVTTLESDVKEIKKLQKEDSAQLDRIEKKAEANTSITAELVDVLTALRGAGKVVGWVAKAAKPIGAVGTLILTWHTLGGWVAIKTFIKSF